MAITDIIEETELTAGAPSIKYEGDMNPDQGSGIMQMASMESGQEGTLEEIYFELIADGMDPEAASIKAREIYNSMSSQPQDMMQEPRTMAADGGIMRTGFKGGGSDASTTSFSQSYDSYSPGSNTASRANKTVDARQAEGQRDADRTNDRISNTDLGREQALNNLIAIEYPEQKQSIIDKIKNSKYNNPYTRGAAKTAAYMYNPAFLGTATENV